jgi:hypothetical protein
VGNAVDLGRHLGHTITVAGLKDESGVMVKSVKMISTACP